MKKYEEMASRLLPLIGGLENIVHVTHCATRLRIDFRSKDAIQEDEIRKLPSVAGIVNKQGQIQIIIGPQVNDAYNAFLTASGWKASRSGNSSASQTKQDKPPAHGMSYWMNKFGNFVAPIFMPVVPAMIVVGMVLAIRTLLVNYFGLSSDGGTAQLMMCLYTAGFTFLPVYLGYSFASQLKMQPIMGAFLGAVLICDRFTSGSVTDFFGIPIPQVSYGSSIVPILLGVGFMYWIDKGFKKILPDALVFFFKPLLTMVVVVPVEVIVLGPLGNTVSTYVGVFFVWLMDHFGWLALPVMSVLQPYMVMFGIDKALSPISMELLATLGYNPLTTVSGFISNLCIGGTALAVAMHLHDKEQKGMLSSAAVTALCGMTEPAFYGGLIMRPRALIGTAIGACVAGIVGGILGIRTFIVGACPGLLTFLNFIDPNTGSIHYVIVAAITAVISVAVSFVATKIILDHDAKQKTQQDREASLEALQEENS